MKSNGNMWKRKPNLWVAKTTGLLLSPAYRPLDSIPNWGCLTTRSGQQHTSWSQGHEHAECLTEWRLFVIHTDALQMSSYFHYSAVWIVAQELLVNVLIARLLCGRLSVLWSSHLTETECLVAGQFPRPHGTAQTSTSGPLTLIIKFFIWWGDLNRIYGIIVLQRVCWCKRNS